VFTVFAYAVFTVIALLNSSLISQWIFNKPGQEFIFIVALFSMWANGIFYLASNQLRWMLRPTKYSIVNLVFAAMSISLSIYLVLILHWGVLGAFTSLLITNITCSILALYYARDNYKLAFDTEKLKEMLVYSIPLVPSSISVFVFSFIDRIAIKEMMTLSDLGIYGMGFRFASCMTLLTSGAQMAFTPLIYAHYKEKTITKDIERIFRFFLLLALISYLGLVIFSRDILALLTTPLYYSAADIIPFLVPSIFLSGMYVFAPGLWIIKRTKIIAAINIVAAVLNTLLNVILIPVLGINGAAVATLASSLVIFIVNQHYSNVYYPIPYQWVRSAIATGVVVVIIGSYWVLSQYYYNFIFNVILVSVSSIIVVTLLIDKGEIRNIIDMTVSEIKVLTRIENIGTAK
jgi:O-antigen/teichoic acid export membrane protein